MRRTVSERGTRPRIARAIWNISERESESKILKVMQERGGGVGVEEFP